MDVFVKWKLSSSVHSPSTMQCLLQPLASVGYCACAVETPKRHELARKAYSLHLKLCSGMQEEVLEMRSRQYPLGC